MSLCRQNYDAESEAAVNKQINMELHASYVYLALAAYFDRDDVHFPGAHKFFLKQSHEERDHAEKLVKFQNDRGGRVVFTPVSPPDQQEYESPLKAMEQALALEKRVNESLLQLHDVADKHKDPHMTDFIEEAFLNEQVESIRQISGFVAQMKRCGGGLGEYMFDEETLGEA